MRRKGKLPVKNITIRSSDIDFLQDGGILTIG